ncbi:MAG TPA: hypothetical protein VGK45_09920, partial [Thermoanaerobaculia bacterium]
MPDWFYRTVTQPVFFRLPAVRARDFALGFMGRLARLPFGPAAIDFLGHMRADPRLRQSFLGFDFPTAIGLGPGLDGNAVALPALARFGFGFLDVGPVTVEGAAGGAPIARHPDEEALWSPDSPDSLSLAAVAPRIAEASRLGLPLIVRLGSQSPDEHRQIIEALAPHVSLFAMDARAVTALPEAAGPRTLLLIPADLDVAASAALVESAVAAGAAGLLIDGSVAADSAGRVTGKPARQPALEQVRHWRQRFGPDLLLIASGGVHEPEDALALRAAGADLVEVDSGLVYSGPGLPKRINEALLFAATRPALEPSQPIVERAPEMTWFWTALMGAGMLFGSLLALVIALTRVVLPYDEAFVSMSRGQLMTVNPHLLAFMAHDRVSLAGTMVAIGAMYVGLSLAGIRNGLHWAQKAVFVSAFTGFASFFLFLGFGYLDNFHAFVTAVLMQLLLLGLHSRLGTHVPVVAPPLRGD